MYICTIHGELSTEWCNECDTLINCDHSDQTYTRIKDLRYDCNDGERTATIRIYHCATCGDVTNIE